MKRVGWFLLDLAAAILSLASLAIMLLRFDFPRLGRLTKLVKKA